MDAESRTKNGDCCKEVAEISELTFAPTAREDTFKLFMALATLMNWDLRQLDVRSAFTNAMLIITSPIVDCPVSVLSQNDEFVIPYIAFALNSSSILLVRFV